MSYNVVLVEGARIAHTTALHIILTEYKHGEIDQIINCFFLIKAVNL